MQRTLLTEYTPRRLKDAFKIGQVHGKKLNVTLFDLGSYLLNGLLGLDLAASPQVHLGAAGRETEDGEFTTE